MSKPTRKILLLNADYMPISIIGIQRACILIWGSKAKIVESYEDIKLRTANIDLDYPSIIVLTKYVTTRFQKVPLSNRNVYKRDKHTCVYCGTSPKNDPSVQLTIDHVIPRALGGTTTWVNVATACKKCNSKKADTPLDLLDNSKFPIPNTFRPNFLMLTEGMKNIPDSWKPYLMYT